jgi:hypothetical protein
MGWQMTWGFIILGILFIAIFAWERFRKVRILGFSDIVLIGFGIWMLATGLFRLFGIAF